MKMSKKLATIALAAGITITSLGGCSNSEGNKDDKNYVLAGTMLDNVVVVSIDGDWSIVRESFGRDSILEDEHSHYKNIITGECVTSYDYCSKLGTKKVENIEVDKNWLYYLTEEELKKAINNELTNEDIISIFLRIKSEKEDTKEKTK